MVDRKLLLLLLLHGKEGNALDSKEGSVLSTGIQKFMNEGSLLSRVLCWKQETIGLFLFLFFSKSGVGYFNNDT